jgi:uncharacterized protein (UPF0332 family)
LRAAKLLYKNSLYEDAVSRAYYAMFHAAKAVLLLKGIKPKTHKGLITKFGLEFVNKGYVDKMLGQAFSTAREDREYADYDVHVKISAEEAEITIDDAEKFIDSVKEVLCDYPS